ncbi:MAG: aminopeptidase family protein [Acidobacteriaceae bacterium]|nr:aminopeptidase family protein [Acidobacteriaceae bacterium]
MAMEVAQFDALVLRLPENVLLLSGFWPMIGAAFLVFPLDGTPVCIIPDCYKAEASSALRSVQPVFFSYGLTDSPPSDDAVRKLLSALPGALNWRRIGYEAAFEAIAPSWNSAESLVPAAGTVSLLQSAFPNALLVDASGLLKKERRTKTKYEISRLEIASEISAIGLEAFQHAVDVGRTGVELAADVEREVMVRATGYRGAVRVRAYAQVTVGPEETSLGYRPNVISTTRQLRRGEIALLELGLVADGYWADRTRARVAGTPSELQQAYFDTVVLAQEAAIASIKPGISASTVDMAARSTIQSAGFANFFPHITGHGLGFGYHESAPILGPRSQDVLEAGMLTSVEPALYDSSFGGIRIEDDVLVTSNGSKVLGPYLKSLI